MHSKSYQLAIAWNVSPGQCKNCGRTPETGLRWQIQPLETTRKHPLENALWECLSCEHKQFWKRSDLLAKIRRVQEQRRRHADDLIGVPTAM